MHYGRAVILVCWTVVILLALIAVAFAFADRRAGRTLSRRAYITLGGSVVIALVGTASVFNGPDIAAGARTTIPY